MKKMLKNDSISKDGISGARLAGIFLSSMVAPWIWGLYAHPWVEIFLVVAGVLGLILSRKEISSFLYVNDWKKQYWIVYFSFLAIGSGVLSRFMYMEDEPFPVLDIGGKLIALVIFCLVWRIFMPPNTWMAKFCTNNWKAKEDMWK